MLRRCGFNLFVASVSPPRADGDSGDADEIDARRRFAPPAALTSRTVSASDAAFVVAVSSALNNFAVALDANGDSADAFDVITRAADADKRIAAGTYRRSAPECRYILRPRRQNGRGLCDRGERDG